MPLFDTDVQELKNKVLREVASLAFDDALTPENTLAIAEKLIPEGKPTMRCCIYKERAIINQRVKLALGGNPADKNVVEVLPIACDECPVEGIMVTQACRGCIAHHCLNACPKNAISIVDHHAVIDRENGEIQEALGSGLSLEASFGSVAYDGKALTVTKPSGETEEHGDQEERAVCFAVIDRRTGEVVLMRSYSL